MTIDELIQAMNGLSDDERRKVIESTSPDDKAARFSKVAQAVKDSVQNAYAHVMNELVNPWAGEVEAGKIDDPQLDNEKIAAVFSEGLKG